MERKFTIHRSIRLMFRVSVVGAMVRIIFEVDQKLWVADRTFCRGFTVGLPLNSRRLNQVLCTALLNFKRPKVVVKSC